MTTTNFSATSNDGYANSADSIWATARTTNTANAYGSTDLTKNLGIWYTSGKYRIAQVHYHFDTSSLGTDNVTATELKLYMARWSSASPTFVVVESEITGAPGASDANKGGDVELSDRVTVSTGTLHLVTFTLNAAGRAKINRSGTTYLALREAHDVDDSATTAGYRATFYFTESTSDPQLTVTHEAGSATSTAAILL